VLPSQSRMFAQVMVSLRLPTSSVKNRLLSKAKFAVARLLVRRLETRFLELNVSPKVARLLATLAMVQCLQTITFAQVMANILRPMWLDSPTMSPCHPRGKYVVHPSRHSQWQRSWRPSGANHVH